MPDPVVLPAATVGFRPLPQRIVLGAPPKTFSLRRGRVSARQADALSRLWPALGVRVDGKALNLQALFGRRAAVVLDIGCGMGEATALAAAAEPDRDLLAVDVHTPGLGNLLSVIERQGLRNVRVADGDVRTLLADMLAVGSLAEVRVWFPDPWPKTRHARRRLLTPAFLDLLADRVQPGGLLHVATDAAAYAGQIAVDLAASGGWRLVSRERPAGRPTTRFERQGQAAGRPALDLLARRGPRSPAA